MTCAWRPSAPTSRRATLRKACRLCSSPSRPARSATRTVNSTRSSSPTSTRTAGRTCRQTTSRWITTASSPSSLTPHSNRPMAQSIHISTLRRMLKAGDPVDLKLWTKSGEIQCWRNCIPLRYNFYQGTQQFKLLDSRQIRTARLVCIFEINSISIFL